MADIAEKSQQFLDVTINKWGTEESDVHEIVRDVHNQGEAAVAAFEASIEEKIIYNEGAKYRDFLKNLGLGSVVNGILKDEMRGAELTKALNLYETGKFDNSTISRWEAFEMGLVSSVDFSSTSSKLITGGVVVGMGVLAVASAPVAAVAGAGLLIGTAVYGTAKILKNGYEIISSQSENELKDSLTDLGEGVGVTVMSAPFVPKLVKVGKDAVAKARANALPASVEAAKPASSTPPQTQSSTPAPMPAPTLPKVAPNPPVIVKPLTPPPAPAVPKVGDKLPTIYSWVEDAIANQFRSFRDGISRGSYAMAEFAGELGALLAGKRGRFQRRFQTFGEDSKKYHTFFELTFLLENKEEAWLVYELIVAAYNKKASTPMKAIKPVLYDSYGPKTHVGGIGSDQNQPLKMLLDWDGGWITTQQPKTHYIPDDSVARPMILTISPGDFKGSGQNPEEVAAILLRALEELGMDVSYQ